MVKTLRLHTLAKELGVSSKEIIEKCRAEGVELKNHMAAISVGLAESIHEWFSAGEDVTSIEVAERVDLAKVRKPTHKKAHAQDTPDLAAAPVDVAVAPGEPTPAAIEAAGEARPPAPEVPPPEALPAISPPPVEVRPATVVEVMPGPAVLPPVVPEVAPPFEPVHVLEPPPAIITAPPPPERLVAFKPEPPPPPEPVLPAGPKLVPKPAELRGPRLVRIEAPEPLRPLRSRPAAAQPGGPGVATGPGAATPTAARRGRGRGREREEDSEALKLRARSPRRRGVDVTEKLQEWRDQDLLERRERLAGATGHGLKERRAAEQRRQAAAAAATGPVARKAPIEIAAPIQLKDFCAAAGAPFATVSAKLLEHTGRLWTINQSLDADNAELIVFDLGLNIAVVRQKTALERLEGEFEQRERAQLIPRPPVVAMLGHVDHGKTSLLDAIRKTAVAAQESGGITQHIGAYCVERDAWRVTFLDTPGHEAFTAMRARGANLTDVVALVVAADDGVMPQTVEALNHARAAGVQIVVALNKIDLPNIDLNRVYAQLSEQGLVPSEWGGDTDVIKTSALTGQGIDELIAHLGTLSELMDLKADPNVPVRGTVIEAQMREGRGVVAQVLVHEGTLRPGQFIVCGAAAGRVRGLRDDKRRTVKEAPPGLPVEVSGLDELPRAGDRLHQVDDLKQAKQIAEEVRHRLRTEALQTMRKPRTLEDLLARRDETEVPELNVIVKADVQGSVDVLKKTLSEFPSTKAQLRILHAAVGAISEADVQLAHASDAIIIGFYIVPEERARQLADQLGVEIRLYRVIYEILDDMLKALAGLLEPLRREEQRGAAEVRQVFNITRVGTVAGCYVTSGTIVRSHKARLIRDSRVVVEGRTLQSLRRFKEDVREVRTGIECGLKLEGYDDVKPGDVVETYEVVEELQSL